MEKYNKEYQRKYREKNQARRKYLEHTLLRKITESIINFKGHT